MSKLLKYSKIYLVGFVLILILLISFRLLFYYLLIDFDFENNAQELKKSLLLGVKFDVRLSIILNLPLLIFVMFFNDKILKSSFVKKLIKIYFTTIAVFTSLFYMFDMGHFQYLGQRVNSTVLRFSENPIISLKMVWQSYPILWGVFALFVIGFVFYFFISKVVNTHENIFFTKKKKIANVVVLVLFSAIGIYGNTTNYPLRWSEAFFSKHNQINQFSLNPVLYFYDSFKFRKSGFDTEKTKKYFPQMREYLSLDKNSEELNFVRKAQFGSTEKPNIVVVMLESLGVSPIGHFGNPMRFTPNIDSLINNSLVFSNFFVPRAGTARSVFASITGLPDVEDVKTASRNPMIVNQRIIPNQFEGYEKLYFLGGSANWANIRAVFNNNIENLKIYEEGSYENEDRVDVWGIDDNRLFEESDNILRKLSSSKKPFFAYIQTSSNHSPFTVPDRKGSFKPLVEKEVDMKKLEKSGYTSLKQANALRYLDFNINEFIVKAKKSGYYDNTIFLFFGDHNGFTKPFTHLKHPEYEMNISQYHTPLIIHYPKKLKSKIVDFPANLIDIMPTLANISENSFTNYTLGKNLLKANESSKSFIYTEMKGKPALGLISQKYFYITSRDESDFELLDIKTNKKVDNKSVISKMDDLVRGIYNSTRYLYFNNKKD